VATEDLTRRDFLVKSSAATAAFMIPSFVFSQGSAVLKVGLIGCGGRGTGAVEDCFKADPGVVLWAMGDVFKDRLDGSRRHLSEAHKARVQVPNERAFAGFDAYQKVIDSGVDIVILTAPPGFRPEHFRAAVAAGKHVFMEKPVAVDGPGIRTVFEASDLAKSKGLSVVAGTQRRHDFGYREVMKRIHDGAIGDITTTYAYWCQGGLWMHPRQDSWSDMEWQLRNWLYFTWLSGDHIVEQHVHNIDVCNWAMGKHPIKAYGSGGRQARTDPAYGHIYDHFNIEFEYEGGAKMLSACRQIDGTAARVHEQIVGTKGTSNASGNIRGENSFRYDGPRTNPYEQEHRHLIEAIRSGKPINEGRQVAESTLTAIMGRMAAYTGQEITWEQALNSKEDLTPSRLEMGNLPIPAVAVPGKTRLV